MACLLNYQFMKLHGDWPDMHLYVKLTVWLPLLSLKFFQMETIPSKFANKSQREWTLPFSKHLLTIKYSLKECCWNPIWLNIFYLGNSRINMYLESFALRNWISNRLSFFKNRRTCSTWNRFFIRWAIRRRC